VFESVVSAELVILSGAKDLAEKYQSLYSRVCPALMTPFSEILRSAQDDKFCVGCLLKTRSERSACPDPVKGNDLAS
jgi:hypothetical protein